jgi:hypothetical protein
MPSILQHCFILLALTAESKQYDVTLKSTSFAKIPTFNIDTFAKFIINLLSIYRMLSLFIAFVSWHRYKHLLFDDISMFD